MVTSHLDTCCRAYEEMYRKIASVEESDLQGVSGCKIPCNFLQYRVMGEPLNARSSDQELTMWMATTNVEIKTEEFIYPFRSFVADVGGILGLFLGVSFLSLLDVIKGGMTFYRLFRKKLDSGNVTAQNELELGTGDTKNELEFDE